MKKILCLIVFFQSFQISFGQLDRIQIPRDWVKVVQPEMKRNHLIIQSDSIISSRIVTLFAVDKIVNLSINRGNRTKFKIKNDELKAGKNNEVYIWAISNYSNSNDSNPININPKEIHFGKNGGEKIDQSGSLVKFDAATITVNLTSNKKSEVINYNFNKYRADLEENEISENILTPSQGMNLKVSVLGMSERKEIILCIYNKNGDLLRIMDPTQDGEFITDKQIIIIPFILPTTKFSITKNIIFEIGDPLKNGSVVVTEESPDNPFMLFLEEIIVLFLIVISSLYFIFKKK